jgi:P4 family phage/plasmid primase-like protien
MSDCPNKDKSPSTENVRSRIVATYDYVDEKGKVLYQTVRFEPKRFLQRRPDGQGSWIWNLEGAKRRVLYRLPELLSTPLDQLVFIVEGEKDVDRLYKIGLVATTNAMGAHAKWISEYNEWLHDRIVCIIPDNDDPGRGHEEDVSQNLLRVARRVSILRLPNLPEKGDVSDWLDAGGTKEELLKLAGEAPILEYPGDPEPGLEDQPQLASNGQHTAVTLIEANDDPHRLARVHITTHLKGGLSCLRFWREEWLMCDGCSYRKVPEKELHSQVCTTVKAEFDRIALDALIQLQKTGAEQSKKTRQPMPQPVTTRKLADVKQALASLTTLPASVQPPTWLHSAAPFPAAEALVCRNGIVHLPEAAQGRPRLEPLTPFFFTLNALTYDFNSEAPAPAAWLKFLHQLWPEDPESIQALMEWFGYLLLPDTSQHKILLVVGPPRSGKGTIARVLTQLVGASNICNPTLSSLATQFGLQPLIGKTVALISDARLSGRPDLAQVTERLLSISGEDGQTIDRKHLTPITDVRLPVRFILMTNELPRLVDTSGALAERLVILRLTRSWLGKEDRTLTNRLLTELPSILNWSIQGWMKLQERGKFLEPSTSAELAQELRDLASPAHAFVCEHCVIGPQYETPIKELYAAWKRWCEENGKREPGTKQSFGRDLRAVLPNLEEKQPRIGDRRIRLYKGVGIKP